MDYIAYPENHHVRSNVTRGSNVVEYEPRLIQLHAVAREDNGTMHSRAACNRLSVRFSPEDGITPWEQTNYSSRCLDCAGVLPRAAAGIVPKLPEPVSI